MTEDATTSIVSRLEKLDACAVSDALDELGLPGATTGLRPMTTLGVVAGRAMTVEVGPRVSDDPAPHLATPAIEEADSSSVMVIASGGIRDVSSWGGVLSHAAQQRGVRGVVVDGDCRDVDEARDIGFAVYARGAVPITARGRIVQRSHGEPVTFAGIDVAPGDLVIADGSGVVFAPYDRAEEILDRAERIAGVEQRMTAAVRSGQPVTEVMHDTKFQ